MAIESSTVLAYNVSDALSDATRLPALLDQVRQHEPTVAVFSEAYKSNMGPTPGALEDLERLGYVVAHTNQEVFDERPDAHGLVVIARAEQLNRIRIVTMASRFAIKAEMVAKNSEKPYVFVGYHGNDKDDKSRVKDVSGLLDHVLPLTTLESGHQVVTNPTLLGGDLNTMDPHHLLAKALRSTRLVVDLFPSLPPNPAEKQPILQRKASIAQRLSRMAIGEPLEMLRAVDLKDIDPRNESTIRKVGLAVKIDHILASRHFDVIEHQVLRGITVDGDVSGEPLSDHDAILGKVLLPRDY